MQFLDVLWAISKGFVFKDCMRQLTPIQSLAVLRIDPRIAHRCQIGGDGEGRFLDGEFTKTDVQNDS